MNTNNNYFIWVILGILLLIFGVFISFDLWKITNQL